MLPSPEAIFSGAGDSWRPAQDIAVQRAVDCNKRWILLGLPVGLGKSLVAMTIARVTGAKTLILTSTKGLQDQYEGEYSGYLHDLRGSRNYPCALLLDRGDRDHSCDLGPCHEGEPCVYLAGGCAYYDALRDAARADVVVTNYAMYYALQESGQVGLLGDRDLLICDEAHDAARGLGGFAGAHFGPRDIAFPVGCEHYGLDQWQEWAGQRLAEAQAVPMRGLQPRQRLNLKRLLRELSKLVDAPNNWIADYSHQAGWSFEPVWPRDYTAGYLWREASKVVLLSATLRPSAAERELGLQPGEYEYFEPPSPFPVRNRPIYLSREHSVRVNYRMSDLARENWVGANDAILASRPDRAAIIHTVSYERGRQLVSRSKFAAAMYLPRDGTSTREIVKEFKARAHRGHYGGVLVSPSIHTGYGFAGASCRLQIIAKVPFPDTRYGLAAARHASDPEYAARTAITTLLQMSGRPVRGPEDWAETFVVDSNFRHLYRNHLHLFPRWFREAYKEVEALPKPLEVE